MRMTAFSTALCLVALATSTSASIILTETNCSASEHIVIIDNMDPTNAAVGTQGFCSPVAWKPYRIIKKDGEVEEFDDQNEFNERARQLKGSIES